MWAGDFVDQLCSEAHLNDQARATSEYKSKDEKPNW
jgi:hypothetical protein